MKATRCGSPKTRARRARIATQARPDLVLLDIWMPDTDGITLFKEWASAGLLTMPVVMMSGHGTIDTAVRPRASAPTISSRSRSRCKNCWRRWAARSNAASSRPSRMLMLATLGRAPVVTEFKQRLERVGKSEVAAA